MPRRSVKRHMSISAKLMLNVVVIVGTVLLALNVTLTVTTHTSYYNKVTEYLTNYAMSYDRMDASNQEEFDAKKKQLLNL